MLLSLTRRAAARSLAARRPFSRRQWLVAASVLLALAAAYLFVPRDHDDFLPVAYTQEPLPLTDKEEEIRQSGGIYAVGRRE